MLPPTPLSLLCAILLCLPLAVIFTFTAPTSTTSAAAGGGAAISPLPITITPTPTKRSLAPTTTLLHPNSKNLTTAAAANYTPPRAPPAEDEAEDQALFNLASRVDPTPRPVKKVAFMFLATTALPLAPLWELFFSPAAAGRYNVYVHAAANYSGAFANRTIPSGPTRRHTPSLIAAARRLLAHALLDDGANAMFALLSPSCAPLHSFSYTHRVLTRSRRSFVEILRGEPGARERWAARGEDAMLPEVGYDDFRIGSQFWVVRRRHAKVIVRDRRLWSKFRLPCLRDDTCYPEEHYFPTLLSMVDPRGCTPCTLTHVDWRDSRGGHPRTYAADEVGPELIGALRRSRPRYGDERSDDGSNSSVAVGRRRRDPFLFARKFSPGSLHRLINIANDVIFKD
ncbi:glycosyltransferase BC10 [Salvia miltiorrhiza]|uniref:glycosyltransferase BC10 n=1 Tax=Salvia miltiorrhiza TaxID=226208 RepID=UPI0025AB8495|nr:glycosyltransferase BC10 [Salvia miltiorrhiza]